MISTFLTSFPLIFEVLVRFKVLSRLQKVMFDGPCNYLCATLCTHRQRPKHAMRPDSTKLLDESDVGARSFEIMYCTATKQPFNLTLFGALPKWLYVVWSFTKLVNYLCHCFTASMDFDFHCFCSFPCQKFGFFFHIYSLSFAKNSQEIA